jgi:hypothetical protein
MTGNPAGLVRRTASIVCVIWAVVLYLSGIKFSSDAKHGLAYVPSALGLLVVAFDKWAWRWSGIHRLSGRPRIDGTWRATLTPNPDSHIPADGNRGPIAAAVLIEQTFWTVHVTLLTAEAAASRPSPPSTELARQPIDAGSRMPT